MRKNKFSSAANRRWQRRYERIQRRKEEEKERQENSAAEVYWPVYYPSIHDFDIPEVIYTAPTVTVSSPDFDRPNRNGTVINQEIWEATAEQRRQTIENENVDRIMGYIQNEIYQEFQRAAESYRRAEEIHEQAAQATAQSRGYRARTMVVDDFSGFTWENDGYIFLDGWMQEPEPEQELEAGDSSMLDDFLNGFLTPGV